MNNYASVRETFGGLVHLCDPFLFFPLRSKPPIDASCLVSFVLTDLMSILCVTITILKKFQIKFLCAPLLAVNRRGSLCHFERKTFRDTCPLSIILVVYHVYSAKCFSTRSYHFYIYIAWIYSNVLLLRFKDQVAIRQEGRLSS